MPVYAKIQVCYAVLNIPFYTLTPYYCWQTVKNYLIILMIIDTL